MTAVRIPFDALRLSCPIVLGNKDGKCISEILYGKIGKCINLHRCGKCCHGGSAKAVDQTLYSQNTKIHNGLLQTGKSRETGDLAETFFSDAHRVSFSADPGI